MLKYLQLCGDVEDIGLCFLSHLEDQIWAAYVPGQEITKTPSRAYVEIANKVQEWIKGAYPN